MGIDLVDAAPNGDGAPEVEVTDEMLEVGADVLMDQCDLLRPMATSIARVLFLEMIGKSRLGRTYKP